MFRTGELIASESEAVADAAMLSVTLTVKLEEPAVVGVPEIVPAARLSPAGSDPLATDHVYGGDPPLSVRPCEYAAPSVPAVNAEVVMLNIGALTASDRAALMETEVLSVTLTVNVAVPVVVGLPDIVPAARLRPAGSDPLATDHVYGGLPPVALSTCE